MFLTFRLRKELSIMIAAVTAAVFITCLCITNTANAFAVKVQDGVKIPIIMYHSILKEQIRQGKYVVSPSIFESDINYLKKNGYETIVIQDLVNYVDKGAPLPQKPIMLTFDDGYYNNYFYAYPIAKKYNVKIVISPIGYYTDLFSKSNDSHPNYSYLTWNQISEMTHSGFVEIQNHTYDLHSRKGGRVGVQKLYRESKESYSSVISADLTKMQQLIKDRTGYAPTAFVYPFGEVCQVSLPIIKSLGFRASLTCQYKMNYITKDPDCLYCMGRYLRSSGMSSERYFSKIGI